MPTYRCQVIIPHVNGLARDAMTNTFHFIDFVPQPLADLADDVTPLIETLYESVYTGSSRGSSSYAWFTSRTKWYDLAQPQPRVPYELPLPLNVTPQASVIPNEVSIVSSFQANPQSGIPQARRRGRVYLGGLGTGWFDASGAGQPPRLNTTAIGSIATAFDAFRTAVAGTSARWAVWSTVDQAAYLVDNGWVENDPDTQRRRGSRATVRTTWS